MAVFCIRHDDLQTYSIEAAQAPEGVEVMSDQAMLEKIGNSPTVFTCQGYPKPPVRE